MVKSALRRQRAARVEVRLGYLLKRKSKRDGVQLSLRKVEAATGIGASTLLHWKNGHVTRFDADKLVALCDVLRNIIMGNTLLECGCPRMAKMAQSHTTCWSKLSFNISIVTLHDIHILARRTAVL